MSLRCRQLYVGYWHTFSRFIAHCETVPILEKRLVHVLSCRPWKLEHFYLVLSRPCPEPSHITSRLQVIHDETWLMRKPGQGNFRIRFKVTVRVKGPVGSWCQTSVSRFFFFHSTPLFRERTPGLTSCLLMLTTKNPTINHFYFPHQFLYMSSGFSNLLYRAHTALWGPSEAGQSKYCCIISDCGCYSE